LTSSWHCLTSMADKISTKRRSENMRQIRSVGTKPERDVCRIVRALDYKFRRHIQALPGKPDIVFPAAKKVIEVRGCFWHQHKGCIDSHIPKTKISYWRLKLRRNVWRDARNLKELKRLGWRVLVVWECQVKSSKAERLQARLKRFLTAVSV
jgi:DNA mismatch endonuclease (patch repair protein)